MRPKRSSLDIEAELFVRELDVVVQELEPRLLRHSQPYDASPAKVRECANSAEGHEQLAMPTRYGGGRCLDFVQALRGLLTEKLERQVQ